ncbi:MAG: hypothetical protein ACOCX1_00225, partial [Fimbriimonadaceae bacterium]
SAHLAKNWRSSSPAGATPATRRVPEAMRDYNNRIMPGHGNKVWTKRRRWLGNLVPLALGLILAVLAFFLADLQRGDSFVELIGNLVIATLTFMVATWLFTNLLGQFENGAMRHELIRFSIKRREPCRSPHYFVGFASPGYRNALDPHEDVGFIYLKPDRLEFFGDSN